MLESLRGSQAWFGGAIALALGACFSDDNLGGRRGLDAADAATEVLDTRDAFDGLGDSTTDEVAATDGDANTDALETADGDPFDARDRPDGGPGDDAADSYDAAVDSNDAAVDSHDAAVDSNDAAVDSYDVAVDADAAVDSDEPERCGADLFLSEYLEGTGWAKALEIANHTGRDVDLDGYVLWKITNGGDWAEGAAHDLPLEGRLADGDVLVLCHASAPDTVLAACDLPTSSDLLEFNGDDALALTRDGRILDVVGDAGDDPGVGWNIGDVAAATADHTLRRRADVVDGTPGWAPETWQVFDNGRVDDLGRSLVDGHCPHRVEPHAVINELGAQTGGADFIEIAVVDPDARSGALEVGGWVVASTSGRYVLPAATTVPAAGFLALSQGVLGFRLGLVDRVWLYDADGQLQDLVGWDGDDLARGASFGRLPDVTGALTACSVATPGAPNRNPDTWCGDGVCQDDERCGECPGDCPLCRPEVGDLVIAEVLPEPGAGAPEWIELVNVATAPLGLDDLVLRDARDDVWAFVPGEVLAPGDALVIGSGAAGYVDLVYSAIGLGRDDTLTLERGPVVLDRVSWMGASPGVALSLSADRLDPLANDAANAWCAASDAFADGLGTPGLANPSCAVCGDDVCDARESCELCAADCGACPRPGCATGLFFSEYVEGLTFNKAIEIANMTGVPVDLADYEIWRITNGGSTWDAIAASARVPLSGVLASGDVWVGCNARAVQEILDVCDATYGQGSVPTSFNGDDALALAKDGVIIDVIGDDSDPGTGWEVAGVRNATVDHTLERHPDVSHGNPDWASSAASEWDVHEPGDTSLGTHEVSYVCEP